MAWGLSTTELDALRPHPFHAARLPVGVEVEFSWRGKRYQGRVLRHTFRQVGIGQMRHAPRVVVEFEVKGRRHECLQPPLDVRKLKAPEPDLESPNL